MLPFFEPLALPLLLLRAEHETEPRHDEVCNLDDALVHLLLPYDMNLFHTCAVLSVRQLRGVSVRPGADVAIPAIGVVGIAYGRARI